LLRPRGSMKTVIEEAFLQRVLPTCEVSMG
jgi:hypothetical protein